MNDINYRIYGRSKGRKKINLINEKFYKKIIFDPKYDIIKKKNNILDIGSGNGENTIHLANCNPNKEIIACDKYYDGNINLCNKLIDLKLNNVKIYNDNINKLLDELKCKNYFNEIWILFPDPWPKKRHNKRRLIDSFFLRKLYDFLNDNGKIYIATDSIMYFISILKNLHELRNIFIWKNDIPQNWIYNKKLPKTKFFKKSQILERTVFFFELLKI